MSKVSVSLAKLILVPLGFIFFNGFLEFSVAADIAQTPLFLSQSVDPRVMLLMSRDHQLSIKAYTDYSDLNGDGVLDTTYNDAIDYYGYFDNHKCYTYSDSLFEPAGSASGTYSHHCNGSSSQWSGNFLNWATMTRMDIIRKVLYGGFRRTDSTTETVLERTFLPYDTHAFAKVFHTSTTGEMRHYVPYEETTITLCNLTHATGLSRSVDTSAYPPLLRVAKDHGSGTVGWPYWAASEKPECTWGSGIHPSTSKRLSPSGSGNSTDGLFVRIKVCVSGSEEANCKTYPNEHKKPTGLLQKYGEASRPLRFGLITGSYKKNKSGGVLRKNIGLISDEIDSDTGRFIHQGSTDAGIINTINRLRIASYNYTSTLYENGCNTTVIPTFSDDQCIDWGNPLSEMYLEALRYLSGKTSASFSADDSSYIPSLPQVSWVDPLPSAEWCANHSIVALSTGLNSFDTDQLSNDLGIDVVAWTNTVGSSTYEDLNGKSYLIGENGSDNNQQCSGKTVNQLSSALGICPEVPHWKGGYHLAGLAYYARTHDMRTDRNKDQNINTYSVALAESLPRFNIPVGTGSMTLLPACQGNDNSDAGTGAWRSCALLDVKVESVSYVANNLVSGSLVINWDASQWGYDFDMDASERLEFCVGSACSPAISADRLKVTTSLFQAALGRAVRVGFTITGSTADGPYFPIKRKGSGAGGSDFTSLPTVTDCHGTDPCPPRTPLEFEQGSSTASLLENPLWYAAKYGSFIEENSDIDITNDKPDSPSEWDANGDGVPDGFFKATNPAQLEAALDQIFSGVVEHRSSSTSVATNSTRLGTDSMIYQAKFNSGDWSGHLLAFAIDNSNGSIGASATWDAAGKIPAANNRQIFTFNTDSSATVKGIRFEWDGLSSSQQTALKTSDSDSLGPQRLDYLRGIRTQERQNGGTFRNRGNLLGDIVNSDPLFVGVENHGNQWLPGVEGSSYLAFRNNEDYLNRRKMIYVGANDGMLHAFNAEKASANAGTEVFAYVPHAVFDHLIDLTSPSYSHQYYVDGSPVVADVYFDGAWRTLLVGTTGAGGRGVFGLDVTDPTSFDENNVLWEFTQADDPDLGYTLSEPSIFRMQDGHWAVIVANGYNSDAGKAVLFILDAKDGGVIKKIDTESAGNGVVAKNGLSSPIAIDVNGDRIIDDIYAGDLLGNVWKFDVSSIHPADWDIAYEQDSSPAPLFVACANDSDPCLPADRQPITAKLQVGQVGASQTGGMMVYFGTGKYFEEGDEQAGSPPQMQTFYGIWDQNTGDSADDIFSDRASLQQQTIDFEATAVNSAGHTAAFIARVTSQNAVNYAEKRGWFLNFITPSGLLEGERVVSYPFLRNGRLLFTTLIPNSDLCSFGGSGWTMELEALTGNRLNSPTVDFFGKDGSASPDGNIGEEDKVFFDGGGYVASGEKSTSIPEMPGIAYTNLFEYRYQSQTDGSITTRKGLSGMTLGRQSWIQLR